MPAGVRPSESRVRAALFSIWGERVVNAHLLDLFAGSGAVGLEAASRGALEVTLIEADPVVRRGLATNVDRTALAGVRIVKAELPKGLVRIAETGSRSFDLVFADPPYAFTAYPELLDLVVPLLHPAGELVVEHSCRTSLPREARGLVRVDERRYGESALAFYRLDPPAD